MFGKKQKGFDFPPVRMAFYSRAFGLIPDQRQKWQHLAIALEATGRLAEFEQVTGTCPSDSPNGNEFRVHFAGRKGTAALVDQIQFYRVFIERVIGIVSNMAIIGGLGVIEDFAFDLGIEVRENGSEPNYASHEELAGPVEAMVRQSMCQ